MDKYEKLKIVLGDKIKENVLLADYTTLKIGGAAKLFIDVDSEGELQDIISLTKKFNIAYFILAGGSNLLVRDSGFDGLVIRIRFGGITKIGNKVLVRSGENLQSLVDFSVKNGLSGMECITGIPGTVGGAIYGNAGAYGQSISDCLTKVKILDRKKQRWVSKVECKFEYRESVFKKHNWVILESEFKFQKAEAGVLMTKAASILKLRRKKYPDGLKSPGSFFKNILIDALPKKILERIPVEKIAFGKIPAGYLLEVVGAKGKKLGDVKIADYHANLFLNVGSGSANDFCKLAKKYQEKVEKVFGIKLTPEVQFLGFGEK